MLINSHLYVYILHFLQKYYIIYTVPKGWWSLVLCSGPVLNSKELLQQSL